MSSLNPTHGFFSGAFAAGLFYAILTRTGMDVSPSGLGLTILGFLEPYVTEQNYNIFKIVEVILYILPLLGFIAAYVHHGKTGLVVYGAIIIGTYLFILYFWKV